MGGPEVKRKMTDWKKTQAEKYHINTKGHIMTRTNAIIQWVHLAQPVAISTSQTKPTLTGQIRGPEQTTKTIRATSLITPYTTPTTTSLHPKNAK